MQAPATIDALLHSGRRPSRCGAWVLTAAPLMLLVLLVLLVPAAIGATSPATSAAAAPAAPEVAAQLADVRARELALEASTQLDPVIKARAATLYRRAAAALLAAEAERSRAMEHAAELVNTPEAIATLQRTLATDVDTAVAADTAGSMAELEQRLVEAQSELARQRGLLAGARSELGRIRDTDPAVLLAALEQERPGLTAEVDTLDPEVQVATRMAAAAESLEQDARAERLHQQVLSRDLRMRWLELRQRQLERDIAATSQHLATLQTAIGTRRQLAADSAGERARSMAEAVAAGSDRLREIAQENASLAALVSQMAERTAQLAAERRQLVDAQVHLERRLESLAQQLAVAGARDSAQLGAAMLRQRQSLLGDTLIATSITDVDSELTRAQLERLNLESRRAELARLPRLPRERAPDTQADSGPIREQLETEQLRLLDEAVSATTRYAEQLSAVRSDRRVLQERAAEYRLLLDRRLFWIPSTLPITAATTQELGGELAQLLSGRRWALAAQQAGAHLAAAPLTALLVVLLLALLMASRPRQLRFLHGSSASIGNVSTDSMRPTWLALALSLLLAVPGPLLLGATAALLASDDPAVPALGKALGNAASLYFLLETFRQICRSGGLAEAHFRWSNTSLRVLRRSLPRLMAVLIPITVLLPLASVDGAGDTVARILFAVASVALSLFLHRVLRPGAGALAAMLNEGETQHDWLVRWVLHPIATGVPLLMLALAFSGYYFTATELQGRLFISVCAITGALLVFYLVLRALSVAQRRMTLARVRARREAQRAHSSSREAADSAGEGMPDVLEQPMSDMATINSQTRALLKLVVITGAVLVLVRLWADLLPALTVLDDIILWQVTVGEGPVERAVTLGSLLLAALVAALTAFAVRNLSGALELSLFSRMDLAPGSAYAINAISKYALILVGVTVVLQMLGAEWSKLQWLVAALGVGLGFGMQEIVANFVSGLLILFERPIRVGDTITVGTHTGTVSRIRIRATTLTDWDRKEQIIPNKTFITEQLTNWTLSDPITRLIVRVGVAYGSDVERVHTLLSAVMRDNPRVVAEPPPSVFFVGFGDSSLNFEIRVFIMSMLDMMPLTHELHVQINRVLKENGVEIPFPQRDIHIRSERGVAPPAAETGLQPA